MIVNAYTGKKKKAMKFDLIFFCIETKEVKIQGYLSFFFLDKKETKIQGSIKIG